MTIQWYIVLLFLGLEMLCYLSLVMPLPVVLKKKVFQWVNTPYMSAKLHTIFRVSLMILGTLLIDSCRTWYKLRGEEVYGVETAASIGNSIDQAGAMQASLYLAQRNAFLSGFAVFMLLVLRRFSTILTEVYKLEKHLAQNEELIRARNEERSKHSEEEYAEKRIYGNKLDKVKYQQGINNDAEAERLKSHMSKSD
eukprot:GEZU01018034.1.p1 GENE.GEZU01018034.1~~GEZU01018034.1.p1  ORF type:complete len:207 (-),score=53.92 GEZU01018034.1:667-1254(-)